MTGSARKRILVPTDDSAVTHYSARTPKFILLPVGRDSDFPVVLL